MSFLNSVLSSIETGDRSKVVLPLSASKPQRPVLNDAPLPAKSAATTAAPSLKRKQETPSTDSASKARRLTTAVNSTTSAVPPTSGLKQLTVQPTSKDKATRPIATAKDMTRRPVVPAAAAAANQPANAPPKKGSYKEIMARAQAAKLAQSVIGQIKHKPVSKLSRRERQAQALEAAKRAKAEARPKNGHINTAGNPAPMTPSPSKERPKAAETGYSGTMRPATRVPAYQGTGRSAGRGPPPSTKHAQNAGASQAGEGRYKYASYSDEEDEEAEEESYGSDQSDDMEGGGFDELEREEEESLRAAKREDEIARRQEEKHRQDKLARKKRLTELAAAARAKKG